jgi:hypothetical protein
MCATTLVRAVPASEVAASSQLLHSPPAKASVSKDISLCVCSSYRSVKSQLSASFPTHTCKRWNNGNTCIMLVMPVSPLPVSEVAATRAAVSRPTASHPAQRHLCPRFASMRARVTGASALHIECMQTLQIIVCEEPIPSRLLLRPPLHTYCGTCMEIRFVTHVTGNLGGLPYCNSPFRLSYKPRRKKRRRQFPLHLKHG